MTDSQWLERLAVQAPQDFSEDEIAELRQRLSHSSELRVALAAQLQTDQMLAHALRQANVSADEIVDRAGRASRRVNRGTLVWLALAACMLLLTGVGGWLLHERSLREAEVVATPADATEPTAQVVENTPPTNDKGLRIEIEAEDFARGNVAIDRDKLGKGIGVIHSANKDAEAFAEYDVETPKGSVYAIEIRAACYGQHPFAILVNGKVLTELAGTWSTTEGMGPDSQRWNTEGVVALPEGKNLIRFETRITAGQPHNGFPEIDKFALSETSEPETSKIVVVESKPPWEEDHQLTAPSRTFEQVCFEAASPDNEPIAAPDLARWFKGSKTLEPGWPRVGAHFEGLGTLVPAWPADGALRMSIGEFNHSLLCFWRGDRGVGLRFYSDSLQWAAYTIERKRSSGDQGGEGISLTGLLATDDDRAWRTNPRDPALFDFRCQQGRLVVSRGDIQMVNVPFVGPPDQVQLDHAGERGDWARIGAISLIHSSGLPSVPQPPRTRLLDIARPATMAWSGELPKGSEFKKLDDGSVELRTSKIEQRAWQGFKLPKQGLCELVVELDDVQPGARFYLGDDQCRPLYTIGYMREKITGQLGVGFLPPDSPRAELLDHNPAGSILPVTPPHHWLRLVVGCGTLKFWTSVDGVFWSRLADPAQNAETPFAYSSVGLECAAPNLAQGIQLRHVELRQLDTIKSLAPDDLYDQASSPRAAHYKDWLDAVDKQKPAAADSAVWRRACALRTLATGTTKPLGMQLLDGLCDDAMAGSIAPQRIFDFLDDVALLSNTWADAASLKHVLGRYERWGLQHYRDAQTTRPFTMVANRMFNAPISSPARSDRNSGVFFNRQEDQLIPGSLYRPELYELVYAHQWDDLRALVQQLRLLIPTEPQLRPLDARLGHSPIQVVRVHLPHDDPNHPSAVRVDRRHPLIEEFNKDEYNILTEFEGAIASKGYRDACKMVSDLAANELQGVLPNSTDPNWLLSLSTALGLALRENPNLRQTMVDDFGPLAALRFKTANSESDAVAMRGVSVQFQGTPAAGDAELWLGDRALAGGEFLDAREQYRRAERDGSNASSLTLAMRQRLAAAFLGLNEGQPITAPVELGTKQLSAAEFETIVADLQQRGANRASTEAIQGKFCEPAPAPTTFNANAKLKLAGDLGSYPQAKEIPEAVQRQPEIDWAGRQMALALDGDTLYASNRFQVWAIDAKSGGQKWTVAAPDNLAPKQKPLTPSERARTFDWLMTPMRPLPVGDRVFVRRLIKPSPELACLNAADGKLIWRTARGLIVASDPVMVQDQLFVLTVAAHEDIYTLNLAAIDASTGDLLTERKLADVRDSWWAQRNCQLAPMGNRLVALCGAAVVACDYSGRLRWIRKQEWFADPEDHGRWAAQRQQPALVAGERLFATQPGVRAIECIDTDSGKLRWCKVLPSIRGIVDLIDNRLIAETDEGLVALDAETGKLAWRHDASDLVEAKLAGGPGKLAYLRRDRAADPKKSRAIMVWLDPATGQPLAQSPIDGIESENIEIGPLAVHGDHIWALVGKNEKDPLRELFELAPSGQPAQVLPVAHGATKLGGFSGL